MMAASPLDKFNAAVKVIRGLPKNGSFQPSHELMLKFYAYYKQATEGPCCSPKPGIWNIVNRKKWEAWSELGSMEKEDAMLQYVDELKNVSKHVRDTLYPPEIVETMPQTEQVAEFVDTLGAFYELVEEGGKDTPGKPNGTAPCNGQASEEDRAEHSAMMTEMLKINNNDSMKANGPSLPDDHRASFNGNGTTISEDGSTSTEEDDEEEEEEEEDGAVGGTAAGGLASVRADSGSDSEEFCDTSDQITQMPAPAPCLRSGSPLVSTSTPVDTKREARVRFAAHLSDKVSVSSYGNNFDLTGTIQDTSDMSSELLAERLGLGTPAGMSFLPHTTLFPPRQLTESLYVNNSCSSLISLAGSDDATGFDATDSCQMGVEVTTACQSDLVTSRGGGDQEASHGAQGSYLAGQGGRPGPSRGSRDSVCADSPPSKGGRARRGDLFSSGSGGGGQRGGGEGQRLEGSLEEQILVTLLRLQQDMADISKRLASLELVVKVQREEQAKKNSHSRWWPFPGLSKRTAFLLIVWPFLVPLIINILSRRRRSSPR